MFAHQLAPNVYARLCQTIRPMPKNILLENFQSQATSVRFGGKSDIALACPYVR
jgi:hypothetical protein